MTKIEIYKGVEIFHDAEKDIFRTNIVVNVKSNNKKEFLTAPRLQQMREHISKFLNTATKKPVLKKAWVRGRYGSDKYVLCDIVRLNCVSNEVQLQGAEGKTINTCLSGYNRDEKVYIYSKDNNEIVSMLNKKIDQINKLQGDISCGGGRLIPLGKEHFK